ncbi:MAG: GTPase ObgE [Calditrichaeota bacterium]|nr:MAG: GTPase ObgE [Calditrichota bacterium]MBL1206786.1 GTPase ObgE [Calditrichota bacterium]NOG46614.1 GTPase ObgE [Calditrichota bacterium]
MFIDFVKIRVSAGNGGSGCMSFRREKFIDKGGPDGGDGGRGASIIFIANKSLHTLRDYTYRREYKAKRGQHGMGSNCHGKKAEDITLEVPIGTVVKDVKKDQILVDFTKDQQRFVVAKGGRGGKGNARYTTATHQSPREWEVGLPGEERELELELKSIADIGFVGFPNAGKSTLLSRLSKAKPKIANYPFTTLAPNLGIVSYKDFFSFVIADIPGLIEGAHEGKGLGHQFLRHIERTRALAYILDITGEDPLDELKTLQNELKQYSAELAKKPLVVVLNKTDIAGDEIDLGLPDDIHVIKISAVTGENIDILKDAFFKLIKKTEEQEENF